MRQGKGLPLRRNEPPTQRLLLRGGWGRRIAVGKADSEVVLRQTSRTKGGPQRLSYAGNE